MRFHFDKSKAAQAAAYIVQRHGGSIDLMALIKLLYLADRTALIESGYPITGDRMVSMPHGPVLSGLYDCAKWIGTDLEEEEDPFSRYLSPRDGNTVHLVGDVGDLGELSDYEVGILDQVFDRFGHLSAGQLRRLTHDLPEYTDPQGSMIPIDPAEILSIAGASSDEIRRIAAVAAERLAVAKIIAGSC